MADAETFRRHLRNDHKEIALENYFAECVKGKDADGARKTGEEEVNQMCQVLEARLDSPKKKTRLNKTEIKRNKREALNQCKFQCPSCQSVFSSWKDLRAHRREKSCSQCRPSQRGVTVKKVVLKCLLCKKEVLSDHFLFRIHLNKHHGLANVDWYQLEVAGKGKEYKHRNVRRNKPHQRSKLKVSVPLVNSPLEKQVMPPKSLPDSLMTASVSSLCQFKCTRCTFEHEFWSVFVLHAERCIGNRTFSPSFVKEARYHKCGLCAACILCDTAIIEKHYKSKHNILHREKYLQACKDEELRKVCYANGTDILTCSILLKRLSSKTLQKYNAEYERQASLQTVHNSLDLSGVSVSKVIDDLCEFSCNTCGEWHTSRRTLQHHRRKGQPCEGKTILEHQTIGKAVAYKCLMCHRLVLCDRLVVRTHILNTHRMKLPEYVARTGHMTKNNKLRKDVPALKVPLGSRYLTSFVSYHTLNISCIF